MFVLLGTVLSCVPCSSAVVLLILLVFLPHRELVPGPTYPMAVAVSVGLVGLAGVAPVFDTVLIVVQPAVDSRLVCSVGVEGALLVARPSLAGQRRRSSAARHHPSCSVYIDNCCSCTHLESFHTSTVPFFPAGHCETSGRPVDNRQTSASLIRR